jgi:hypothetical protein
MQGLISLSKSILGQPKILDHSLCDALRTWYAGTEDEYVLI